jgi:predicted DNA-binding helix-hairpin-helix protein
MENNPPTSTVREHRLYQASFLLRDYGFTLEDLTFEGDQNLPLTKDPKQLYAEAHLRHSPLEINRADRSELLRVPGIGPKGADAILRVRGEHKLSDLSYLTTLGIQAQRTAPFILLDGQRPVYQMSFW